MVTRAISSLVVPATPAARPAAPSASACPSTLRRRTLSCRATDGRGDLDGILWLPRRDVLAGLTLTGVAAGLVGNPPHLASAAVETTELKDTCRKGEKVTDKLLDCTDRGLPCPPPPSQVPTIIDFKPEAAVKRVRRPAHLLDREHREKYREAVGKMRALPESHPLSFTEQAAIHEAYCDGHYRLYPAEKNLPFDVHFSWIFAPWHRMYLYFYERALGQLIGDDTFALPYWSWDTPAGMAIPAIFKDSVANPLYDANRDRSHVDALIDLDYLHSPKGSKPVPFKPPPEQAEEYKKAVQRNLSTVYHQQVRSGKGALAYLGEKLCSDSKSKAKQGNTSGSLERMAHTAVHVWTGRSTANPGPGTCVQGHDGKPHCNNDMGFLGSAGRDPLFYSHHSNVDRMWHLWSKFGGKGFDDPEWLDTSFVFYDDVAKPRLVRVRFRDVLATRHLGYTYDAESEKDLPWLKLKPTRLVPAGKGGAQAPKTKRAPPPAFPLALKPGKIVEVPGVAVPAKQGQQLLVLVIKGIEFDPSENNKFDVAVNLPGHVASEVGPEHCEYAGTFVSVPSSKEGGGTLEGKLSLVLDDVLADIGAEGATTIDVVIVPRAGDIKINLPPVIKTMDHQ